MDGIALGALVEGGEIIEPMGERILGRVALEPVEDPFSHEVIVEGESIPGPKVHTSSPPWRSSLRAGTNHEEMPGPVAIARQTSSGVPGTWTST